MKFSKTLTAALAGCLLCATPVLAATVTIDFDQNIPIYSSNPISEFQDASGAVKGDISVNSSTNQAWLYNTNGTNGQDGDLQSPFYNVLRGEGTGLSERTGFSQNAISGNNTTLSLKSDFGNALIIQEPTSSNDNDPTAPDDDAAGGTIIFDFDTLNDVGVKLLSIDLLDASQGAVEFQLFGSSGLISSSYNLWNGDSGNSTPNWYETVLFGTAGVTELKILMSGVSGAIDNIVVETPLPPSNVPIPAAAWLFASALGVFGYLGKRKSKA